MSIKLICGEPGAGKSLYTMRQVIDLIRTTSMPIVTNLPVRPDPWMKGKQTQMGLRAYLDSQYGETFDIDKRLRFITDEECAEFYTHRGFGIDAPITKRGNPTKDCPEGKPEEFDIQKAAEGGGVIYVIDECWKFFGSRDWQAHGEALTFYAKQHRKPGDEVFFCTHDPKDLDTGIRRVAETTVIMRNHARMRMGLFRQPGYFSAEHYARVPTGMQTPMHTERFKLDAAGIAQTYDTSAGVGLKGGTSADAGQKKSGLHFGWLIVLVAAIAIAVTQIPKMLGKAIGSATLAGAKSAQSNMGSPVTNSIASTNQSKMFELPSPATKVQQTLRVMAEKEIEPIEREQHAITGLLYNPRTQSTAVMLSNGERYELTDPSVRIISKDYMLINGKLYYWKALVNEVTDRAKQYQPQVTQRNYYGQNQNAVINANIPRKINLVNK